jgi:histidinol phosphatase-like PHP family hydrolase/Icc-related predicted phosphoesterase
MADTLRLLILSDCHFDSARTEGGKLKHLDPSLGAELAIRAYHDAIRCHGPVDAIVFLGDVIHAGNDTPAEDYARFLRALTKWTRDIPILAVPGNCDIHGPFFEAFNCNAGLRTLGGYRFFLFADRYPDGPAECIRDDAALADLAAVANDSDAPLIVLQHNPILPFDTQDIIKPPANADAIADTYRQAGVMLSLSGHNHAGQALTEQDGVNYMTVRSLGVQPHGYTVIDLAGREICVAEHSLLNDPALGIWDTHIHTELAYCSDELDTPDVLVRRAAEMNVRGMCIVEHAAQLLVSDDDFWKQKFIFDPTLWIRRSHDRMEAYFKLVEPLRSPTMLVGLEIEIDHTGTLTCHPEELARLDFRLGAVHWLPEDDTGWTAAEKVAGFLRATERLLACDVDALAHPMRYLYKAGSVTDEACRIVADMLAETDTVCEINFHTNGPSRMFLDACLERGVRFTFGSDAHAMWELGNFGAYLELLAEAAGTNDLTALLWRPGH